MGEIDHARFIELLNQHYPEVAADIDDTSQGLLHPEMATLARATEAAIEANDTDTVKRHFAFIDEVFTDAAPDVENAVYVSYLENLELDWDNERRSKVHELLTPRLKQALSELEAHWDLVRKHQKNNPTT